MRLPPSGFGDSNQAAARCYFVGLEDEPPGARVGRGFASYTDVLSELARVPSASR